ncbi:MAG: P-type conjugative transfer protein TrbJ [Desulfovibrionaceae bacterium]|nr:P-type conjugative transfer protein TrbJ [Desulfovibrionaceae bacterium]
MKNSIIALSLFFSLAGVGVAGADTVYCTNCSDRTIQAIEKAQSADQLKQLAKTYAEELQQTEAQLRMVQQNIEQYQNMLQNTLRLPATLRADLRHTFHRLAMQAENLKTYRADITALSEIFSAAYPDYASLVGIVTTGGPEAYREQWDKWAEEVNRASEATFQLSGAQLADLTEDPAAFDNYIDDLLNTPEGQMQALQSANQLAALQLRENRQLRELMATATQSNIQRDMRQQKEDEAAEAFWREFTDMSILEGVSIDMANDDGF